MCGITGLYYFDKNRHVELSTLESMTQIIEHRGPDGDGFFVDKNIGLAHRRLAIIDLEAGKQPMEDPLTQNQLVFNGGIYNYIELREELKQLGHRFYTESDTEVILAGYRQWGVDVQNKLNGMWAFALWDFSEKRLLLSRDRMGEKPLYYGYIDGGIIFGSEIKSLFASKLIPKESDLSLLDIYLTLGYIPAPYSFFNNIKKLCPGEYILLPGDAVEPKKYWSLPDIDENNLLTNKNDVYKEFEELFYDSVKIRMRSDVPFGAFLSGGLDSASVVAVMSEISDYPVETFTIGFDDKKFDERHLAQAAAEKYKTNHNVHVVKADTFEDSLSRAVFHHDEPFGDSSSLPTSYVSQFAREKVKMVLTGDGGDELLSGYTTYQGEKFAAQFQKIPSLIRKSIPPLTKAGSALFRGSLRYRLNRVETVTNSSNMNFIDRLISKHSWSDPSIRAELLQGCGNQVSFKEYLHDLFSKYSVTDPFYKLMYFQMLISLPDNMLTKVDRMSMAKSIETRIPFLDHRLVELMVKVHKDVKMEGYERKSVLRNTIGKKLPNEILHAPKKGFSVPLREWFKSTTMEDTISDLYKTDFGLNSNVIKNIIDENSSGKADHGNYIWMLFMLKRVLEE